MEQLMLFNRKPTLWQRVLARLLFLANSEAGNWDYHKHAFYRIKDRILQKYGRGDGCDLQKLVRYCNSCEGTGGLYEPGGCYKCRGDGIYEIRWVWLARFEFAGYVFHKPVCSESGRLQPEGGYQNLITGYVRHADRGHAASESLLWIALLYNRRLFIELMTHEWYPTDWRYPLLATRKFFCRYARWQRERRERQYMRSLQERAGVSDEEWSEIPF